MGTWLVDTRQKKNHTRIKVCEMQSLFIHCFGNAGMQKEYYKTLCALRPLHTIWLSLAWLSPKVVRNKKNCEFSSSNTSCGYSALIEKPTMHIKWKFDMLNFHSMTSQIPYHNSVYNVYTVGNKCVLWISSMHAHESWVIAKCAASCHDSLSWLCYSQWFCIGLRESSSRWNLYSVRRLSDMLFMNSL